MVIHNLRYAILTNSLDSSRQPRHIARNRETPIDHSTIRVQPGAYRSQELVSHFTTSRSSQPSPSSPHAEEAVLGLVHILRNARRTITSNNQPLEHAPPTAQPRRNHGPRRRIHDYRRPVHRRQIHNQRRRPSTRRVTRRVAGRTTRRTTPTPRMRTLSHVAPPRHRRGGSAPNRKESSSAP